MEAALGKEKKRGMAKPVDLETVKTSSQKAAAGVTAVEKDA